MDQTFYILPLDGKLTQYCHKKHPKRHENDISMLYHFMLLDWQWDRMLCPFCLGSAINGVVTDTSAAGRASQTVASTAKRPTARLALNAMGMAMTKRVLKFPQRLRLRTYADRQMAQALQLLSGLSNGQRASEKAGPLAARSISGGPVIGPMKSLPNAPTESWMKGKVWHRRWQTVAVPEKGRLDRVASQ